MRAHPANQKILEWMGYDPTQPLKEFGTWDDRGSGFDEAGKHLCDVGGINLPAEAKVVLPLHCACVHPTTALIYAVSYGRFTFLGRKQSPKQRRAPTIESLDGTVDLSSLEPQWADLWIDDEDEEHDPLLELHAAAGRFAASTSGDG